jgi:hypothetical protein
MLWKNTELNTLENWLLYYLAKGNLSDAEAEFKKSIEMNPANPRRD